MTGAAVDLRPPTTPGERIEATGAHARTAHRAIACLRVPWVACLVLLVVYVGLSFVNNPRGTLLADSGGKLATMRVMHERGALDPDVGYWAAEEDPDGDLHPLTYTKRIGDAYVQATTLPMLSAAFPLYELGGTRLALLLPMLGGVLCALAARALARRLGADDRASWIAFWAVGLLTPVAIYAVSFWEHTLGVAAMLWAISLAVDLMRGQASWPIAIAVGALFGAAATMRSEALVYAAVTAGVALVVMLQRRTAWSQLIAFGVASIAGFGVVVAANHMLEQLTLDGAVRAAHSSAPATAAEQVGTVLGERVGQAATSLAGVNGFSVSIDWVVGLSMATLVAAGVWAMAVTPRRTSAALAATVVAVALYLLRFGVGVGYVPGLLVASPLAAVGVVAVWRSRPLRVLGVLALVPLPLIWLAQYADTQRYQWGSRYALTSGVVLVVAAVVALAGHRGALALGLGLAVLVTSFGTVFVAERSQSIANGMDALVGRHDDVLISLDPHLFREGGAFYAPNRRWLTASTDTELERAVDIARRAGVSDIALVAPWRLALPDRLDGYERVAGERLEVRPESTLQVLEYHAG